MRTNLFIAATAIAMFAGGAALALEERAAVQHADIARAEAAIRNLPTEQRAQAQNLLDRAREAVNSRGTNGNPEAPYNKVVALLKQWQMQPDSAVALGR